VYRFFGKMLLLAIPLWAFLRGVRGLLVDHVGTETMLGCLVTTAVVSISFLLLLIVLGYGLRIREITRLLERLPGWPLKRG